MYRARVFSSANMKVHSRELPTGEISLGTPLAPFIKSYDRARHLLALSRHSALQRGNAASMSND